MAIGSGLGSSIGLAPEATYGTYVAPTKFLEGTLQLNRDISTYQGGGMAAGQTVQRGSRRKVASERVEGTLDVGVQSLGMGNLLNGLMGANTLTTPAGGTTSRLQTHTLGDTFGKMYTIQAGVPQVNGTVVPYSFLGSQIVSGEFSCETGGGLTAKFNIAAKKADGAQTLAAPTYPNANDFHFAISTLKLGTLGAETLVDGVKSVSVSIQRPKHPGGPYMGGGGFRSQGVLNDWTKISGSITADFLDKTSFADRFLNDQSCALVWEFVGPTIEATIKETFRIKIPLIFFEGDLPAASGPDVVSTTFKFTGLFDGTNSAVTIEYQNTETTL